MFKIFTQSKNIFDYMQSFIEIILVKYINFNFLHNHNHMITRCDRARHRNDNWIDVTKFFYDIYECLKLRKSKETLCFISYV